MAEDAFVNSLYYLVFPKEIMLQTVQQITNSLFYMCMYLFIPGKLI